MLPLKDSVMIVQMTRLIMDMPITTVCVLLVYIRLSGWGLVTVTT